jgi:5'-3' exoribonuclease 1
MNGIIHNCTHSDADSPSVHRTEDVMFLAIFNYVEHLFTTIKPKKLFFMAVDGVAPRAKMNQQRARRFRTAKDAEDARNKAIRDGEELPPEEPFDSNCITPGTEFMAKLSLQIRYFVNKKISEDADWQGVEVVLSGHEVPGEGEHKIMEYIRQAKAQPNYDPNMRHCLYGLDADLIMLGLLSHDPHFCLLREEVKFGPGTRKTQQKSLEQQNFYLMHLCIVREYLELEFQELQEPGALGFKFDMERIIDDFILMAFFVGNDFLPNLPHLHINEGALALMFGVYKTVLPKAKGYINEGGVINLERLEMLLDELSHVEYRFFESENADASWLKEKQYRKEDVMERTKKRHGPITITSAQKELFQTIKKYVLDLQSNSASGPLDLPATLPASDRKFVQDLADILHLQWKTVENEEGERHLQLAFPPKVVTDAGKDSDDNDDDEGDDDDFIDEEAQSAILRVFKRYENAKVEDISADDAQKAMEKKYEEKFLKWKDQYYKEKMGWGLDNEVELTKMAENYVQGLQWVLYYYYEGIASWPWFYKYHYSPFISGNLSFFFVGAKLYSYWC